MSTAAVMNRVLLIGSGGREHAIAWALVKSETVSDVLVAPGNCGTHSNGRIRNIDQSELDVNSHDQVAEWCLLNRITLVVVGPEQPLADGLVDSLTARGVPCFGPTARAAEIESSKSFAKDFMDRHGIPTARWAAFTGSEAACQHIHNAPYPALVVKASGLAAGKGVIVASDKAEACRAVDDIIKGRAFGSAGDTVVVEELLEGPECSCLAFTDGHTVSMMPPAQDHKRLLDHDLGPNTGGMGAYCPCPLLSEEQCEDIKQNVLQKTVDSMRMEGRPYVGVLYAGMMLTRDGPKVLEFNCRFGDPETQVLLPLLRSDLCDVMSACVRGTLADISVSWCRDTYAVGVVMVSGGYPGPYNKGVTITGLDSVSSDCVVFHAGTTLNALTPVTSGGRVLCVVSTHEHLQQALDASLTGASQVSFTGAFYRHDIGRLGIEHIGHSRVTTTNMTYQSSGVDIDAGNSLVEVIKPLAKSTFRPGCLGNVGSFGAIFDLKAAGFVDPLLVSGTDGVGTKLKVALEYGVHHTIGVDLVAMCVNDIIAHGASPLYFLDYYASGKLDPSVAGDVIRGISDGCRIAQCALVGGETAEMPGMYQNKDYDVAGFVVGAVERGQLLPNLDTIKQGDVIIGIASSGIHSNGYSLVRRIVRKSGLKYTDPSPFKTSEGDTTLGQTLLTPTRIYSTPLLPVLKSGLVKAYAHITGGGLVENIPRVLPTHLAVRLDASSWLVPPVFGWLAHEGVGQREMAKTFNCGVGAVLIVEKENEERVLEMVREQSEVCWPIGRLTDHNDWSPQVSIANLESALQSSYPHPPVNRSRNGHCRKMNVAVLISGSGTNLQALIDSTKDGSSSHAEIVLVLSNVEGVLGLERAKQAGIPTKVISHRGYKSRVDFDMVVHHTLQEFHVELVCLAGFMRILSEQFVTLWKGKLINVHPSLLPSFKGMHAHKLALEAGVTVSGCTVHFVEPEIDSGAIIVQDTVPVLPTDTVASLQERVKSVEHVAYPKALHLLTSRAVSLSADGRLTWNQPSDQLELE